jgi:exonuclease VII large subunit
MTLPRIIIFTLLISSGLVLYALFNIESDSPEAVPSEELATASKPAPAQPAQPPGTAAIAPPHSGPTPPAAAEMVDPASDEVEDEAQIEREQIAAAMALLYSTNNEERIEAVEQLGAYPSPETEATLSQLLTTDTNAEVRNAAALSLGSLDTPSDSTINGLVNALADQNEDVRFSALSTLEDFMLGLEEDAPNYKKIREELKAKAAGQGVPKDTREAISEILRDQASQSAGSAETGN